MQAISKHIMKHCSMISISDFQKLFLLKRELKPGPAALITTALSTEAQLRGVQVVGIEGVNFTVIINMDKNEKGFLFWQTLAT